MVAEWASTPVRWPGLAWVARCWPSAPSDERGEGRRTTDRDIRQRADAVRYHLGRGRRAREAGRFEDGCSEARRAIEANPGNPWAYALLGQCLCRQRHPDLIEARRVLERACALDPANGYFVRLLLDVLDAQGDSAGRDDTLAWAWWNGAPVERWLPGGPSPRRGVETRPVQSERTGESERTPATARAMHAGALAC